MISATLMSYIYHLWRLFSEFISGNYGGGRGLERLIIKIEYLQAEGAVRQAGWREARFTHHSLCDWWVTMVSPSG